MSKKFCAKDAVRLANESVGYELEDRNRVFAKVLKDIEQAAREGCGSMEFMESQIFTPEMLCELSNRGFVLSWVNDTNPNVKPSVRITWEQDDE